jgi:hypothetical protein
MHGLSGIVRTKLIAIPDAEDMLSVCCRLVVIDKESEIIRLAHYTVQE